MKSPSSEFDDVVWRGVDNLAGFIRSDEYFNAHWADFLAEFTNISRTGDTHLKDIAEHLTEELITRAGKAGITFENHLNLNRCRELVTAEMVGRLENTSPGLSLNTLADISRRITSVYGQGHQQASHSGPEALRRLTINLVYSYLGYRAGITLAQGYGETLAQALALRPYKSINELGLDTFIFQGGVITHIIYTVTDYNERLIQPHLLKPERELMYNSLDILMENSKAEMLGEFLDALKACSVPDDDPALLRACRWLAMQQNPDGSWGNPEAEQTYKRYHVTLAAVQGLRNYHRTCTGTSSPWITDLLKQNLADKILPKIKKTKRVNKEILEHIDYPISREYLKQRALLNRPALVCGIARSFQAWTKWTDDYLIKTLGDVEVDVEVSDDYLFAHPEREKASRTAKLRECLIEREQVDKYYYLAQAPITGTLSPLSADIACESFLPDNIILQKMLWLSPGERITPLHYDEVENLLVVLRGHKKVTLFPPHQATFLYVNTDPRFKRFCRVDVEKPDEDKYPLFARTTPIIADLQAGDGLIIPLHWWHHVHSYGTNLAVSFMWYAKIKR